MIEYVCFFSDENRQAQAVSRQSPSSINAAMEHLRNHYLNENGYEWVQATNPGHRIITVSPDGRLRTFRFAVSMDEEGKCTAEVWGISCYLRAVWVFTEKILH